MGRRLVLGNDEVSWSAAEVLAIHERTGVPLVFDNLHHRVNNPSGWDAVGALRTFFATWAERQTPKIHFSSQRTADRLQAKKDRSSGARITATVPPRAGQHDDFIDAQEFIALADGLGDLAFDVMLEAKRKDVALLCLRDHLAAAGRGELAW